MTSLSAGAVEGIVNEIVTSDGGDRPVLQVAKFQPVGGANATRHKLWLTDGSRWVYAMAATQVHALLQEGGDFAPGCLVRLLKYSVNDMAGRKIVIVIDLEVAAGPQKLIGAPTGYPNGEALPSDAQPAGGGGAPVPQAAKKPTPAPARAAPRRPSAGGRAAMPIAELNPYQQRFCLRARVTSKSQMRYWDKPTSKGNLFSVDLLDASGEIRGTFFKETADKVFPLLEEGKVYTFQETSGRLKPANKQYTSLSHEFELTFGNVTVEACDDDAGISQIKGDWQPLSIFGDGGGPRDGNIDVVAIVRKAEPVGTIISSKSGKELTKREVVLCDDSGFDIRCTFWGDIALKEDAFWDGQPTLCAKGLRVGDFGGVSLSSGFSSQLLWDSQDIPRSVELRQWWSEGGKDSSTQGLTGGSGGGMGGREVPFGERGVLDDIKSKQLGYGEKPDYIGVAATLNFVRSEKLWYEACASEGCQKKVVQNTDGTWMCEKCNSTSAECQRRYIVSCTFIDDSGQAWVSAFNESALELFGKVDADQLAVYKEEVDGEDGKFESYMKQFNFQRYVLKLRAKADTWNEQTRVKVSIADVKPCDYKAESAALVQALA